MRAVRVKANSRLHFGLLRFKRELISNWQGIGCMVSKPGVSVTIQPSGNFRLTGNYVDRVTKLVGQLQAKDVDLPSGGLGIHIEISDDSANLHVGLGTGTQLAFAVAVGLRRFYELPTVAPEVLASQLGRGRRSAIGTHGFFNGGFLLDGGKPNCESHLAPMLTRISLPENWRFLLICPKNLESVHGRLEREKLSSTPPLPGEITASMCEDILGGLLPAAKQANFDEFSKRLFAYGVKAGLAFAPVQMAGIYYNAQVAEIVRQLRELGVQGVGQSSWGPTVFALLPDEGQAQDILNRLQRIPVMGKANSIIARPANDAAVIEVQC